MASTSKVIQGSLPVSQLDKFVNSGVARIKQLDPSTCVDTTSVGILIRAESSVSNGQCSYKPGAAGADGSSAQGIGQMFQGAYTDSRRILKLPPLTGDALKKAYLADMANPETAILHTVAYLQFLKKEAASMPEFQKIQDTNVRNAVLSAGYNLGDGRMKDLIRQASTSKGFDAAKFQELYEAKSLEVNGAVSDRVAKNLGTEAGDGSSSSKDPIPCYLGPGAAEATDFITMGLDVAAAVPMEATTVIQDGLDVPAWWESSDVVGNPRLKAVVPAYFEIRLNRLDGTSLTSGGQNLQVRLNVGMQSLRVSSQHIVDRSQTATGTLLTFWGMAPDVIVGRGTTGVFMNQFGLTALMSDTRRNSEVPWADVLKDMLEPDKAETPNARPGRLALRSHLRPYRVAAQDAMMEMLALYKNNGLIRFLPKRMLDPSIVGNEQYWSPAMGTTGWQMIAREGEVHTRGYVALKYKGATYLGYFKSFNYTADAKSPYKWDFDFTFKVLETFLPIFVRK